MSIEQALRRERGRLKGCNLYMRFILTGNNIDMCYVMLFCLLLKRMGFNLYSQICIKQWKAQSACQDFCIILCDP